MRPEHPDETCEESIEKEIETDSIISEIKQKGGIIICYNCKEKFQKKEGCNSVKCPRCKYDICARCGGPDGTCSCKGFRVCKCGKSFNSDNKATMCDRCKFTHEFNDKVTKGLSDMIDEYLPKQIKQSFYKFKFDIEQPVFPKIFNFNHHVQREFREWT